MILGEKKKEFASRIGIDPSQLSRYFKGRASPSLEIIRQISEKTGCDLRWLETGQGHAYFPNPTDIDAAMRPDNNKDGIKAGRPYDFGLEPAKMLESTIPTPEPLPNQARLRMALSQIEEMDLEPEAREILAEIIKDLVLNSGLRDRVWEYLRFLKGQAKK